MCATNRDRIKCVWLLHLTSVKLPSSGIVVPGFDFPCQKETENTSLWSVLSSIDICHPAPWLSTGNIKGLVDDGHGMTSALELGPAEETGAVGYRHYATATRVAILRAWSLEGDFPIDSFISLSWINSFPDMSIRWETFFTVWICDTINEKKGTSMTVHLDWELFHNKLLHKTLGFPLFRTWSPA